MSPGASFERPRALWTAGIVWPKLPETYQPAAGWDNENLAPEDVPRGTCGVDATQKARIPESAHVPSGTPTPGATVARTTMDADVREPIDPRQDGDFRESLRRVPCGTSDCGSVSADATSGAFTYGAEAPDGTKMLQIADSVTSILPPTVAVRRVPGYLRILRWPVPARFSISSASVPEYHPKAMFSAYRSANCEGLRPVEAQPADGPGTGGVGRSSLNERSSLLPRHPTPRPATVRLALGRRTAGRVSSRLRDRSSGRRCRPACRRRGRLRRSSEESSLRVPRLIPTTREGPSRCRDLASPATTPPECARRHASRERRLSSVAHAARRRVAGAGQPERI